MLRDLARQLADGVLGGIPAGGRWWTSEENWAPFLTGNHSIIWVSAAIFWTDIPKKRGIEMAVRTLSPDYVICDELGGIQELEAVRQSVCRGTVMVASIHAG